MRKPSRSRRGLSAAGLAVELAEPGLFRALCTFLHRTFKRARKAQSVIFGGDSVRVEVASLDGDAGAALLTELRCCMAYGDDVILRREFFKRLLLVAAVKVGLPVLFLATGAVSIGLQPRGPEPGDVAVIRGLQTRLPEDVVSIILAFARDLWWACHQQRVLPELDGIPRLCAYVVDTRSLPPLRRLLKKVFRYPCSRLDFAGLHSVFGEWSFDFHRLWLRAESPWPLIVLLRCLRRRTGLGAEALQLHGYGNILI